MILKNMLSKKKKIIVILKELKIVTIHSWKAVMLPRSAQTIIFPLYYKKVYYSRFLILNTLLSDKYNQRLLNGFGII